MAIIEQNHKRFLYAVFSIISIFIIRDYLSIAIPQYFLVAILLIYPCFATYKELVKYVAFIIPISTGMNTILYLPLLLLLIVKCPKINISQIIFTIIFMLMEIILMASTSFVIPYNKYLIYIGMFGTFMFLFFDQTKDIEYNKCIKYFCISTAFVLVTILIRSYNVAGGLVELYTLRIGEAMQYDKTITDDLRIFSINANTIGMYSACAYTCLLLGKQKLKICTALYIVLIIGILLPGAFTTSRTWLILCGLFTIIYSVMYARKSHILILAILLIVFGSYLSLYLSGIIDQFAERLSSSDMATANGRTILFNQYNKFLLNNPDRLIFGTSTLLYKEVTDIFHSTHNGTQQIYMSFGIWGMILFIIIPIIFYFKFIKSNHIKLIFFFPILISFAFVQTIQFLLPEYLMMPFIIGAMAIKLGGETSYTTTKSYEIFHNNSRH